MTIGAAGADAAGRLGMPTSFGGLAKAPYDILADTLRGTKGIMIDRFRRPEKILEACERLVPIVIDWCVRQAERPGGPLVIFVLHKGADSFMSDADFKTFYWPTLKAVMKGIIDQGIVPAMFAEGALQQAARHHQRPGHPHRQRALDVRPDRYGRAKQALRGHSCISGNVPTALIALSYRGRGQGLYHRSLETCAKDGGYILQNGAVLDDAKAENLKAMIDTGRDWRG